MSTRKEAAQKSIAVARERYVAALGTVQPDLPLQQWLSAVQATLAAAKDYRETARKHLGETAEFGEIVRGIQADTGQFLGRLQEVQRAISLLTSPEERAKATDAEKRSAMEFGAALTEQSNPALSQKMRAALEAGQSLDEFSAGLGEDLK